MPEVIDTQAPAYQASLNQLRALRSNLAGRIALCASMAPAARTAWITADPLMAELARFARDLAGLNDTELPP